MFNLSVVSFVESELLAASFSINIIENREISKYCTIAIVMLVTLRRLFKLIETTQMLSWAEKVYSYRVMR